MNNKKVLLLGAFLEALELVERTKFNIIGIIDKDCEKQSIQGHPVLGDDNWLLNQESNHYKKCPLVIPFDDGFLKEKLFNSYSESGYTFQTIKGGEVSPNAKLDQGCFLQSRTSISANCSVGKCVKLNTGSTIMHDCVINDFVTFAPHALALGYVHVGKGTFVGANATILPNCKIGENVIIGAGAVVNKDIPSGQTVIGIPAKPINISN